MSENDTEHDGGLRWMQSRFVLGAARRIYLVIASLSLLLVILGAAAWLLLKAFGWWPVSEETLPPAYVAKPVTLDSDAVAQSLLPPHGIIFQLIRPSIESPLDDGAAIGYFEAETKNGLAAYPGDFDIFGGTDAALFERVAVRVRYGDGRIVVRAGLRPVAALVAEINQKLPTLNRQERRRFEVSVAARDRFGNLSRPATVSFTLIFGPPQGAASTATPMSDLQKLARTIAQHLDPAHTTAYFDAYSRVLRLPQQCGVANDEGNFVRGFAAAFMRLKPRLQPTNIGAFYYGVCAAWKQGVEAEAAERLAKEAARDAAAMRNGEQRLLHAIKTAEYAEFRHTALYVTVGALVIFLFISLFLAFLAIENHSEALRQAVNRLAGKDET